MEVRLYACEDDVNCSFRVCESPFWSPSRGFYQDVSLLWITYLFIPCVLTISNLVKAQACHRRPSAPQVSGKYSSLCAVWVCTGSEPQPGLVNREISHIGHPRGEVDLQPIRCLLEQVWSSPTFCQSSLYQPYCAVWCYRKCTHRLSLRSNAPHHISTNFLFSLLLPLL